MTKSPTYVLLVTYTFHLLPSATAKILAQVSTRDPLSHVNQCIDFTTKFLLHSTKYSFIKHFVSFLVKLPSVSI